MYKYIHTLIYTCINTYIHLFFLILCSSKAYAANLQEQIKREKVKTQKLSSVVVSYSMYVCTVVEAFSFDQLGIFAAASRAIGDRLLWSQTGWLYVCVYVCMYNCMYVYTYLKYMYVYVCMYMYVCIFIYVFIVCMCVCVYVCICVYVCTGSGREASFVL